MVVVDRSRYVLLGKMSKVQGYPTGGGEDNPEALPYGHGAEAEQHYDCTTGEPRYTYLRKGRKRKITGTRVLATTHDSDTLEA